jgi:hypothetical protein
MGCLRRFLTIESLTLLSFSAQGGYAVFSNLDSGEERSASLVVETRKSLHCYFRLKTLLEPEVWRLYQKRLIQKQNSDPAIHNPARLMRFAGFHHQKWNPETEKLEPTPVTIRQQSGEFFEIAEFDRVLPQLEEPAKQQRDRPSSDFDPGWDIRNFADRLNGYNPSGRDGWIT